jgi:rod shape determining protein RodA
MLMVLASPIWARPYLLPIAIMGVVPGRHAVEAGGGGRAGGGAVGCGLPGLARLKPYQKERLTSFMHPEADSQGSGYQVNQSKIAVGSGGIWGKRLADPFGFPARPANGLYLRGVCRGTWFCRRSGVMLLYFIVLMRLTQNAQTAPDRAGTFVVMGVVAVLSFHILVNVGMVVGFMPVTGIPLPLMSYGGSSVLFMFLALGMVMNVRMRRFVN